MEKEGPVALPESKIKLDAEPVEVREESVEKSEEPEVEAGAAVEPFKKPVKKAKRNVKKKA